VYFNRRGECVEGGIQSCSANEELPVVVGLISLCGGLIKAERRLHDRGGSAETPSGAMSITFQCQNCRATQYAKAEHAGRRASCRKCGQALEIPGTPRGSVVGDPPRATPDATPLLLVTCTCGKRFQARSEHAGAQATCPACRKPLTVSVSAIEVGEAVPGPASARRGGPQPPSSVSLAEGKAASPSDQSTETVVCRNCGSLVRTDTMWCSVCHLPHSVAERVSAADDHDQVQSKWLPLIVGVAVTVVASAILFYFTTNSVAMTVVSFGCGAAILWISLHVACAIVGVESPDLSTGGKLVASCMLTGGVIFFAFSRAGIVAACVMPALVCAVFFCLLLDVHYHRAALIYVVTMILNVVLATISMAPCWIPVLLTTREAACDTVVADQLREIGVAMRHFEGASRHEFPASALCDGRGKPLLSWRVQILPFIKGGLGLYREFHLDEPWDSPHNVKLLDRMPAVFASAASSKPATTRMMVFTGDGAPFRGNVKPSCDAIRDGLAFTIMVVEAGDDKAVPWTKPQDLSFDPRNPAAVLGSIPQHGFHALFFDGTVQRIKRTIRPTSLRNLIDPADGQVVDRDRLE
jgi:hypothetical protein